MAGLSLYRSNRIEALAEVLAALLHKPRVDPIVPIEVVVGRRGMERWLRHKLAERLGVCANVAFPFPETKIDNLLARVLGAPELDEVTPDPWSPQVLTWALLEVLPDLAETPGFETVRGYVERWDGVTGAKRLALARQLADVFDRYVSYRPDLARDFSAGREAPRSAGSSVFAWQRALWQAVGRQLGGAPHRADRIAAAIERLQRADCLTASIDPIRVFAVSSMPPAWMSLLGALSNHTDVDLFLLCPSKEYWADLRRRVRAERLSFLDCEREGDRIRGLGGDQGNPLLVSLGRVARDFQIVLESQPAQYAEQRTELFVDPADVGAPGVLHLLQSDLLAARDPATVAGAPEREVGLGDDSIQLHVCHGATRQVEVLRDVLLGLLEDRPDLEPRDVVVMTPDIDRYAPIITSVFSQGQRSRRPEDSSATPSDGWGPVGAPRIPIDIADLSVRRINPIADAVLRILQLAEGRLEASKVVDLLTLEVVRDRFGIAAEELPTVQTWIRGSGIRWGRDAAHRQREHQPADAQNTWRFGLRRLLLGVVMAADGRMLEATEAGGVRIALAPFEAGPGQSAVLLGRFVEFVESLFAVIDELVAPRPLCDWVHAIESAIDRFTCAPSPGRWHSRRVRETLRELERAADAAGSRRELDLPAIRKTLANCLEATSSMTREQSGAVTFCAMQPMRSVPYRIVCLLGMDEGSFPRQRESPAFDLVARHERVGDRNPRDEDRYLLLESILAARETLVVLYTGRDPRTGEVRPPCVPIGELRDVLDRGFRAPPDAAFRGTSRSGRGRSVAAFLTTEHPLHSFSPRAFQPLYRDPSHPGAQRPWSFDRRLLRGAQAAADRGETSPPFFEPRADPEPAEAVAELGIDELIRFFKHPTRYLVSRRLGIHLGDPPDPPRDREPVGLEALELWHLRRELLEAGRSGQSAEIALERLRAEGRLPLGYAGEALVARERELVERMLAETAVCTTPGALPDSGAEPVTVQVKLAGVRVTGTIGNVCRDLLIEYRFASEEQPKHLVEVWLPLLAWSASDQRARRAVLVLGCFTRGIPTVHTLGFEAPEDARRALAHLVDVYQQGIREPVPLFPESSFEFARRAKSLNLAPSCFEAGRQYERNATDGLRQAYEAAVRKWESPEPGGDASDPLLSRVFEGAEPLVDPNEAPVPLSRRFAGLAVTVWGPVLAGRHPSSEVKLHWLGGGQP